MSKPDQMSASQLAKKQWEERDMRWTEEYGDQKSTFQRRIDATTDKLLKEIDSSLSNLDICGGFYSIQQEVQDQYVTALTKLRAEMLEKIEILFLEKLRSKRQDLNDKIDNEGKESPLNE